MKFFGNHLYLLVPPVFAGMALFVLLLGMGGDMRVAKASGPPDICFARPEGGTVYASSSFTPVQAAVDSLGTGGGTVLVAGTCEGVQERETISQTVYISAPLTLRGGYINTTNGWDVPDPAANPTVLDALAEGRVISATAAITIENLTIQNGSVSGVGAGLYANSTLHMTGTQVLSNTAGDAGGGVYADSAATITASRFQNNRSATASGGGIYAGSALTLTNSLLVSNTASYGGGIAGGSNALLLTTNTLAANHAITKGGGISGHRLAQH